MMNRSRWGGSFHLFASVFLLCCRALVADDVNPSFWVWHRGNPLTDAERATLPAQTRLYWQAGELENSGDTWRWTLRYPSVSCPSRMTVIPVVRLITTQKAPFSDSSIAALISALSTTGMQVPELQIDYDCPDRLLAAYANALGRIRNSGRSIGATALAGWTHNAAWPALQSSVDDLVPMFYDLEADPPAQPLPLLDEAKLKGELAEWDRCKIPWRAGLPSFARVTVYNDAGTSLGHTRDWDWDGLCFNTALETAGALRLGVTPLRAVRDCLIGETPIVEGRAVAVRWPDLATLRTAVSDVSRSNADGVVFFRLPDSTDPSGWSLPQLTHLNATSHPLLRQTAPGQLALANDSDGDLPPRLSGTAPLDRGYALEIDAPAPIFREAVEGDFWRVTGHAHPDVQAVPVPVSLATRLTFWFSRLRARQALHIGLIQLAPGADFGQLRYRILGAPGGTEWRKID